MANTKKKAGRKSHVGRPTNAELEARRKAEMHKTNPKAQKDAENIKKGAEKAEDAGRDIMKGIRGFFGRIWGSIGKFFAGALGLLGGFIKGIGEGLKNAFDAVSGFFKGFTDKAKLNSGAAKAKMLLSLILFVCMLYLGITTALAYFTVQQIAIGTAVGSAASYGVYRVTLPENVRKNTSVSIKEMLTPMPANQAA